MSATISQCAGGFGWMEQRIRVPDVVDAVGVVFEEVGGLSVDLERIGVVQAVEIEQLTHQRQCITNGYERRGSTRTGRAGNECRHDVGGVPIEAASGPVVAHRHSRIRVTRSFLDIAKWDAGVEGGDERVACSRRLCGEMRLSIPARFTNRLTIRSAQ